MNILVTGGAGFVGKALVAALEARGERVRVLDLAPTGRVGDVVGSVVDRDVVRMAVEGIDCVFHLAGIAHLWTKDVRAFDRVNHMGTRIVLSAARAAGVKRFVQCSSLTTLVAARAPIGPSFASEALHLDPDDLVGPYPASKRRADLAVLDAARAGFDALVAMPTEPLGPGDEGPTPPTGMILDFLNGKTPASIDCLLNFVPVDSLAAGLIAALDRGRRGERYLLGGENVPMQRLLASLEKASGRKMPTLRLPYSVALAAGVVDTALSGLTGKPPKAPLTGVRLAGRQVSFSSDKARRDLGWKARPFEPALAETVRWLMETGRLVDPAAKKTDAAPPSAAVEAAPPSA
ncbi:MAG: NAD-dependent epimerase/dehydratase family protein [Parvularculaceae bacterium]|nr:NAD-dependent epimerase/dehydratase family protein [Parvularculaceae bacterium]